MNVRSHGVLAALISLVAAVTPLAAQQKVGYVDTRKILQEMPGRGPVEARLRAELEVLSGREKKMVDSLNAMMAAFERDSAKMSQDDRTKRFAALQQYDAQYRDTLQVLQKEAQDLQGEAMQPLFDVIRLALEDVRQADGFAMIFDLGAQVNPIVAMDKNLDLSDKVIARIRTMPAAKPVASPAATPVAPKPTGPVPQPAGVTRKP